MVWVMTGTGVGVIAGWVAWFKVVSEQPTRIAPNQATLTRVQAQDERIVFHLDSRQPFKFFLIYPPISKT
jgi:hypothetical protein